MEKNEQKKLPDFDKLSDRMIAKAPAGPMIGIRTNLDKENPEKYQPYTKENGSFFEREEN